jgi:hypothetical protein
MKVPFSRLRSTIFGSHAVHAFCTSVPVPVASKEVVGVAIMQRHLVLGAHQFSVRTEMMMLIRLQLDTRSLVQQTLAHQALGPLAKFCYQCMVYFP